MPVPTITAHSARVGPELAGVGERVGGGGEAELRHAVDAADLLRAEVRRRVEFVHLAREAHRELGRVEPLDGLGRATAGADRVPERVDGHPGGRLDAHAGDDDPWPSV